ncbi:MAG: hypothetical protein ACYDBB_06460 [Armatimonadota bacterium]
MKFWHGAASLITLFTLGLIIITGQDAHAYLDPGSGSYLIQLAVAALVGGMVALRHFWDRIMCWFNKGQKKEEMEDE